MSLSLLLRTVGLVVDFCPRIPGEQAWAKGETDLSHGLQGLSIEPQPLPPSVHAKYPLPGQKGEYLGALLKVPLSPPAQRTPVHFFCRSTTMLLSNLHRRTNSSDYYLIHPCLRTNPKKPI